MSFVSLRTSFVRAPSSLRVHVAAMESSPHVLFLYRSRQSTGSPVGLGVTALHSVRVLRRHGVRADLVGVWNLTDIHASLSRYPSTTHCIIEAPWVGIDETEALASRYPSVHFIVR